MDEERDGNAALTGIAPPQPTQEHQEHAEHGNAELDVEFSSISFSETPEKKYSCTDMQYVQIWKQVLDNFNFD